MRLATEVRTTYRCLSCGAVYDVWPDSEPCCREPGEDVRGLLTVAEVAELAQVSDGAVRQWIAAGRLAAVKEGRVTRIHPDAWAEFSEHRRAR